MRGSTSMVLGAGSGLVGLVLMVIETVRVLNGSALDTVNNALLFAGLCLLAIGGVLLVIAVVVADQPMADPPVDDRLLADPPGDDDGGDTQPAEPDPVAETTPPSS